MSSLSTYEQQTDFPQQDLMITELACIYDRESEKSKETAPHAQTEATQAIAADSPMAPDDALAKAFHVDSQLSAVANAVDSVAGLPTAPPGPMGCFRVGLPLPPDER